MNAATTPCPFCDYPIPIPLREGERKHGEIQIILDARAIEVHVRYCAKNPEATPI